MDPAADEQLDYGEEEYRGVEKIHYQGGGAIPALADEELMGEDDEYEDLYNDVNVGEGFLQLHQSEHLGSSSSVGNGGLQGHISNVPEARREAGVSQGITNPAVAVDRKYQNASSSLPEQKEGFMAVNGPERVPINQIDGPLDSQKGTQDALAGNMVFQGPTSMPSKTLFDAVDNGKVAGTGIGSSKVMQEMPRIQMAVTDNVNVAHPMVSESLIQPSVENGSTTLYVGELHWWTTDSEIESVLSQYGRVKEIKFFDERASGKSKGYCQVEFYESIAAAACKEKMNGYVFNGRACVVAFASPQTLRQMGAAYMNKTQAQPPVQNQGRRIMNDGAGRSGGMNYQSGDGGRNYGRGGWGGRGGQGILNRGPGGGGGPRGRGPMAVKSSVGNATGVNAGPAAVNFGQGLPGPAFGGPAGGMMHSQSMMGPGFDPTFMGRGAGYGGFSGPPFPGLMPPFPAVNAMGFAGVAPHVNPAFFGRGMTPNGMGMMSNNGMDGHPRGIWPPEPSMGGWVGEEHGRRTRESSYGGDDGASEYGYGEENPEKGGRSNVTSRERERASERDWSENSERRHRDEREQDWDRPDRERRYREEKDSYRDIQQKKRDLGYEVDRDREQASSRPRSRSRAVPEEDHRSRSRDMDYGKRRHAPSE
ncbi:hypothetical protein Nepgr_003378 [Nepenthes gracilis]|uniref:RRM domain-containing protein n=1 Tax=Nepenthes gracilis TaxID=150966 RepID=A0AAD3RZD5_NEPGR|nr:hypothetical protein Nepgr_003378 [Nepenthes gracilis]